MVSSEESMVKTPSPGGLCNPKLAANQLLWDLPLGIPCFLCFPLSCGHIWLWLLIFLFLAFLFDLCLFVFLDFCALFIRLMCCSVTCSPGVGGKGTCVQCMWGALQVLKLFRHLCQPPQSDPRVLCLPWSAGRRKPDGFDVHIQVIVLTYLDTFKRKTEADMSSKLLLLSRLNCWTVCSNRAWLPNSKFTSKRNINVLLFFWSNPTTKVEFLPWHLCQVILYPVTVLVWNSILSTQNVKTNESKPHVLHAY